MSETQAIQDEVCPDCGRKIEYQHLPILSKIFRITCACEIEKEEQKKAEAVAEGSRIMRKVLKEKSGLKKRQVNMTFNGFKPLPEQKEAYETILEYSDNWNQKTQTGLILSGGVGSGKTHLVCAMINRIIDNIEFEPRRAEAEYYARAKEHIGYEYQDYPQIVKFSSFVEFLSDIRRCFDSNKSAEELVTMHKTVPLLVLDDLGAEKPTDWSKSLIYEIVDYRYNEYLPTVVTTNLQTSELTACLGSRTTDRLRNICKKISICVASQRKTMR